MTNPAYWQFLDVLGGAKRTDAPGAKEVYDTLVDDAFRGDIAWDYVVASRYAKKGLHTLFRDMAEALTTADQLKGLLLAMDSASRQSGMNTSFRATTGEAGQILLNRAQAKRGAAPLPVGWADACAQARSQILQEHPFEAGKSAGAFWARTLLRSGADGPSLMG